MGMQWARRIDEARGLASAPPVAKPINTLRAAVETDVKRRLGEAIGLLGSAATFADQLVGQQVELGEAASGIKIPSPAAIRAAKLELRRSKARTRERARRAERRAAAGVSCCLECGGPLPVAAGGRSTRRLRG